MSEITIQYDICKNKGVYTKWYLRTEEGKEERYNGRCLNSKELIGFHQEEEA